MSENLVHQSSDENFGYVENFLVVLLLHSSGESIYLFELLFFGVSWAVLGE